MEPTRKLELLFPKEEYLRRLAAVRQGMASRGIDVLLIFTPANILYLTGYYTIAYSAYQCLFVPMEETPVLAVRGFEVPVALASTWLDEVFGYEDNEDPASALVRALQETGWISRRLAAEHTSAFMSVQQFRHLEEVLKKELPDGSGIVEAIRMIKSPLEVECLRLAARCSEAGMAAALAAIEEEKTENDVAAECYRGLVKAGSEFFSDGPIITSGEKSGVQHSTFQRRPLKRGDAVFIEIGGVWKRYTAALMRTGVVGKPSDKMRKMYDVCLETLEATLGAMRPGVRSEEVQAVCEKVLNRYGCWPKFRRRAGYSIGGGFGPGWAEPHIMYLGRDNKRELQPGMVFHVPMALRELWEFAVGASETVAVTNTGIEILTNFSRSFFSSKK